MIQIPRLFKSYKVAGVVKNFGEMLHNIFYPLFEATTNPEKHPSLYKFLLSVTGFDSVDDESQVDPPDNIEQYLKSPEDWTSVENPPYSYWNYFFYANVLTLNYLRKARGLNSFSFRPHCGEAGSPMHLASSFLVADGINHGIKVRENPVLEYLYYLK